MKVYLFSIFDNATETYGTPFAAVNNAHAERSFEDAVKDNRPDNMMIRHPTDFDLYLIGTFNDGTATIETAKPQLIAKASDYAKKTEHHPV